MRYKKSLISTIFALGTVVVGSAQAEWKYNTEVFFAASDDASVTGIRWLQPWWQDGKSLAYSDLRVLKSDQHTEELNLGGGFRQLTEAEDAIWGAYGFLDYRQSASNRKYTQLTLGGEYLLDKWEFRGNIYQPLKDQYVIGVNSGLVSFEDNFTGNTVTRITTTGADRILVEEALQGYDLEAGYLLPGSEDFEIRANLGLYQYSAPVAGSTQGLRGRIEAFPRENFKVSVSIESDDLFGTRSFLELSLPLGRKIGRPGKRSLHKRMTQFAYRDIDVRETSRIEDPSKRIKTGPGGATSTTPEVLEDNVLHIDSNAAFNPLADGSIELPFNTISDCVGSGNALNCASDAQAKTIYLHADASASSGGNAQHYMGNLSLGAGQRIIGDGVTTGSFANLSTGISPILLGVSGLPTTPVLTLTEDSEARGLQLGWDYTAVASGSSTPSLAPLPAGAAMPDTAILVNNTGAPSTDVRLSDLIITGASDFDGSSSALINDTNNFATGIHFLSESATSTEDTLRIERLVTNFVLGDALYAELRSPNAGVFNSQSIGITSSDISNNGRGIHATVDGVADSSAEQIISVRAPNSEGDTLTNQIQFNLNEGILIENLTTDTYAAALATNLGGGPTPFEATQNLIVKNALIRNNLGAGIQAHYGAISSNSQRSTSTIELENVNLFLNEGSGLVVDSLSSNLVIDIQDTSVVGNVAYAPSTGFGSRLDGSAIDCDNTSSGPLPVTPCGTNDTNDNRTDASFHKEGYGIYATNRDVAGGFGTQQINISGRFEALFHEENRSHIFLESVGLTESSSSQTLDILDESDFVKVIDPRAGEIQVINGRLTAGPKLGAGTDGVGYCDEPVSPTALVDNSAPHITFNGLADESSSTEVCQ